MDEGRGAINVRKAQRLGSAYHADTGLPFALADPAGRELWRLGGCSLANRLASSRKAAIACRAHRRAIIGEAFRWGEPYFSLCPFGLVTFAVPLCRDHRLAGGFLSGFCIFPQMETDMRAEVRQRIARLKIRSSASARPRFNVVPSELLRRSAHLLFNLAAAEGLHDIEPAAGSPQGSGEQFTMARFLQRARSGSSDLVTSLVSMENEIVDKVVLGDLSGSREIVNRFLGAILLESGMHFDMLKVRLLELIVIISRAAMSKGIGAEGLLGPRYSYLTDINAATGLDELFWKVTGALENFTRAVSAERGRKGRIHMARMKEFLSTRFASRVTAREVAAAAGLSVSRALHLFRRECGASLSAYITRQRIDYARYLLENTDRSMAEIASECGFYDQSHFTRTFRMLERMPPLRYRMKRRESRTLLEGDDGGRRAAPEPRPELARVDGREKAGAQW